MTQLGRDILKASKKETEAKITKKLTKSQVGRIFKPLLKRQKKAKSIKILIIGFILLLRKDWEDVQISAFLTIYKENNKDQNSYNANFIKQDPLYILVIAIYKTIIIYLSDFFWTT